MNPKRKINGKTEKTTGFPYISKLKWTKYFQYSKMFGNLTIQILVLWMVAVIKANLNKPWWDTTQGKDVLRYGRNARKKLDTVNWNLRGLSLWHHWRSLVHTNLVLPNWNDVCMQYKLQTFNDVTVKDPLKFQFTASEGSFP